jgi:M6 family metalloprotease-like protein
MIRLWCGSLLGLACLFLGPSLLAADSPPKPDLSDYRTTKDALTREIVQPRAGDSGQTGYLGVSVGRDKMGPLIVLDVQPDSPAAKAGIRKNDILTQLDGEALKTVERLRDLLQSRGPEAAVKLSLRRGDEQVETTATLRATSRPRTVGARPPYLGVVLGPAKEGVGVEIEEVAPESPAAAVGFKAGDHVVKIDSADLLSPARLEEMLARKRPGDSLAVAIRRGALELVLRPMLATEPSAARPGGGSGPGARVGTGRGLAAFELWKGPVFRLAVIGIEFPDVKHNVKISTNDWRDALLSVGTYHDKKNATGQAVHGSLNDYFLEQSAGGLRLEGKVFDWITVSKKRAEYAPGSGTTNITAVPVEALGKLTTRDGKDALQDFDGFLFLYAGEPVRTNRGAVYAPHAGMIRSFQSKRWPYVFVPEGGANQTPLGALVREFGLALGLPSLAPEPGNADSEGLGVWCAMSNTFKTNRPQNLSAWAKEKLGWLKPTVIDPTVEQKLILSPIEDAPGECYKVLVRSDGSEYFLLENRAKKHSDQDLPAEGLLIWRVVKGRPILEESHGVVGPAGPTSYASAVPYPSQANRAFTPETVPSSRSPLGGGLPVSITNIRRLPDGRITFIIGSQYH